MCVTLTAFSDPSTLPDLPSKGDKFAVMSQLSDGKIIGTDMDTARYDKEKNIMEFLEVIIDEKQNVLIASKLAFDCRNHKIMNPVTTVLNLSDQTILQKKEWEDGKEWKSIVIGSWGEKESRIVCPKIRDPRDVDL